MLEKSKKMVGSPTREEIEELVQWARFPVCLSDEGRWFVVRMEGQVVGYVQYQVEEVSGEKAASINFLEVRVTCMRRGYGRLLVTSLQSVYAYLRAHIVVRSEQAFWCAMGFVPEYPDAVEDVDWYWWREQPLWW